MAVRYVDGDLGPYDEFGVCVLVRRHDSHARRTTWGNLRSLATGDAGVLIHRLPVDGEFTMAAGRDIWGFPKTLAEFDTELDGPAKRVALRQDGRLVADLRVRPGLRLPAPGSNLALTAYSHLDGVTRRTSWEMDPSGSDPVPPGPSCGWAITRSGASSPRSGCRAARCSARASRTSPCGSATPRPSD